MFSLMGQMYDDSSQRVDCVIMTIHLPPRTPPPQAREEGYVPSTGGLSYSQLESKHTHMSIWASFIDVYYSVIGIFAQANFGSWVLFNIVDFRSSWSWHFGFKESIFSRMCVHNYNNALHTFVITICWMDDAVLRVSQRLRLDSVLQFNWRKQRLGSNTGAAVLGMCRYHSSISTSFSADHLCNILSDFLCSNCLNS